MRVGVCVCCLLTVAIWFPVPRSLLSPLFQQKQQLPPSPPRILVLFFPSGRKAWRPAELSRDDEGLWEKQQQQKQMSAIKAIGSVKKCSLKEAWILVLFVTGSWRWWGCSCYRIFSSFLKKKKKKISGSFIFKLILSKSISPDFWWSWWIRRLCGRLADWGILQTFCCFVSFLRWFIYFLNENFNIYWHRMLFSFLLGMQHTDGRTEYEMDSRAIWRFFSLFTESLLQRSLKKKIVKNKNKKTIILPMSGQVSIVMAGRIQINYKQKKEFIQNGIKCQKYRYTYICI